jgi:hypothetical protein
MRTFHKLTTAVLLAFGLAAAVPAMADTTVTVEKKHHYTYYPDHQIYFAPDTKVYYWQTNGRWESGVALPAEDRAYVTAGGVDLTLETDRPYERHEWVLKHYKDKHDDDEHEHH